MSLLDVVTGGKSDEASRALEQARADIEAVKTPTVDDLKYQIQKLTQAGVITPQQAKTYEQNPSAFLSEIIPQTGTSAQDTAISDLLGAANEGGLNPDEQSKISEIIRNLATSEKGANDAVVQRQAERGALTGGETMAAQLENNQSAAESANKAGLDTAAEGYNAMLQELTSAGQLGSNLQNQENTQSNNVASAVDAINKFNTTNQQNQENLNVGSANEAQEKNVENLQSIEGTNVASENAHAKEMANLPQEVFSDEMQKAGAKAGISENEATQDTAQGGQNAALIGGLIGTGGEVASAGMSKPPVVNNYADGGEIRDYLNGGRVDGHARVAGDSTKNDTVPAMLSPGEIVLPRSVAGHPQPDRVMAFLNRIRKPQNPHPDDVATILHAMGKVRSGT